MTKQYIFPVFLTLLFLLSCADTTVPAHTLEAFIQKYPTVKKEKWSRDSHGNFEAAFKKGGVKFRADFEFDSGTWIETEQTIEFDDLPKAVRKAVEEKYERMDLSEIEKVDHHSKGVFYDVEFKAKGKNPDIEFNEAGEIIGFEN